MIDFWSVYTNFDILRSIATKAFYYKKKKYLFLYINFQIKKLHI